MKKVINLVVVEGALEVPASKKILIALDVFVEGILVINKVGKGYVPRMREFIEGKWRPHIAQHKSKSLSRAMEAIKRAITETT